MQFRASLELLQGLVFDDEVMDWIVDALHQSHADEKRFRRDAIARLQDEQSKLQMAEGTGLEPA